METIKNFSKQLQERTGRMNRRVLLSAFIAFGVLGSSACAWIIYRGIVHHFPFYHVMPIRPPILLHDIPSDTSHHQ